MNNLQYSKDDLDKAVKFLTKLESNSKDIFDKCKVTPDKLLKKGIKPPSWLANEFVIVDTVENPAIAANRVVVVPVESYIQFVSTGFVNIAPDKKYNAVVVVSGTA